MLGWRTAWFCLVLSALCPGEPARVRPRGPAVAADVLTGQWVWTRTDRERYQAARSEAPALVAGVLIGTLLLDGTGALRVRRGLSPADLERPGLVVRLDDSLHPVWQRRAPAEVARELVPLVVRLVADARRAGVTPRELTLDYDCPDARLADWGLVAGEVARSLDVPVWVTSIPTHLEQRGYGEAFAGRVAGHVLQLFDTGLACTSGNSAHVVERVRAAGLPFRVGVAAFERVGRSSEHACWRASAGRLREIPGWSGQWVFPGGEDVRVALREVRP